MNDINRICEEYGYSGLRYVKYVGNKQVLKVSIKGFKRCIKINRDAEEFNYFVLIDSYGNIIANAYKYLNYELSDSLFKQREQALTALKHLYSFIELFYCKNEADIAIKDIMKFKAFLKGKSNSPMLIMENLTYRTNETINNYMSVYRDYYKFLGIDNSIFNKSIKIRKLKGGKGLLAHGKTVIITKYKTSSYILNKEEPYEYIKYDDYIKCIKHIMKRKKDYKLYLRDILIIHLMYEYGLRIGEVLGITIEDFYSIEESGSKYGRIEIRNRFTDKPYQFAKGCMKVRSRKDYEDSNYYKKGVNMPGYQIINIAEPTVILFEEYMNETVLSSSLSKKLSYNLRTKNNADKVTQRNNINDNKYVFVSKNLTPISGNGWNRNLREIFGAVGVPTDTETKKDGLNHLFRHGFSMYKILKENYDRLRLKNALRHSNVKSCERYFKPTNEDMAELSNIGDELLKNGGIYNGYEG